MPEDQAILIPAPRFIPCDPLGRIFPPGWKNCYFRAYGRSDPERGFVYRCPMCRKDFDHSDIDFLEGDHIWPYSMFGDTSWQNYQLLCGSCNASKKNFIDREIRAALGSGDFRGLVLDYLRKLFEQQKIADTDQLRNLLGVTADARAPS
jgi:hypothetical protein